MAVTNLQIVSPSILMITQCCLPSPSCSFILSSFAWIFASSSSSSFSFSSFPLMLFSHAKSSFKWRPWMDWNSHSLPVHCFESWNEKWLYEQNFNCVTEQHYISLQNTFLSCLYVVRSHDQTVFWISWECKKTFGAVRNIILKIYLQHVIVERKVERWFLPHS